LHISLIVVTLVVGVIVGLWQIKPPQVNEASSAYPAYQSMMNNIRKLTVEPHKSGSAAIEKVRSQILDEIKSMGLVPTVEQETYTAAEIAQTRARLGFSVASGSTLASMVGEDGTLALQNIIVKLDAPGTERGVMLVSHYDSTKNGPGAADDMTSVCAMIEAMRAQAQNGALKNDIYFVITDGEENGLLGAVKYVDAHPELKSKIDMVMNFEARGNRGGLLLFETSPKAYSLLKTAVKSGAKPIGFSWAAAIYAMMPNNTDFTVFLKSGYPGMNFAAIEGVATYHQPTDSYENLNPSTVWQYLQTVLALTDYAANHSLDNLRETPSQAVYFPLLPGVMVLMSSIVSYVLCAVASGLALVSIFVRAKTGRRKVSFSIVLTGLLVLLSIGSALVFPSGSYLFYIPLLCMAATMLLKKWAVVQTATWMVSGVVALLIWVPVLFLLWVSMIQPMLL